MMKPSIQDSYLDNPFIKSCLILTFVLYSIAFAQQPAWRRANGTEGIRISDIDIYYSNPDTLYAIGDSLMLSADMGENWEKIAPFPLATQGSNRAVTSAMYYPVLAIDPFDSKRLYFSHAFLPFDGNVILKSEDGGTNWTSLFWGMCQPNPGCDEPIIEIDPVDLNSVYASLNTNVILRSTDRGENWDTIPSPSAFALSSIAVAPSNNDVIYLGYGRPLQIYKSTDQGQNWQLLPFPLLYQDHSPVYLAVDPDNPDTVYAAVFSYGYFPGGVYKSTDGGFTWDEKNSGLSSEHWAVNDIILNPKFPNEIYLATSSLFKSIDAGDNWFEFTNGLPDSSGVACLAIDTLNQRIFAGVNSHNLSASGVYIYDGITSIQRNFPDPPLTFVLYQNFPNPFNSTTIISYYLPERVSVNLTIFDPLGKEIMHLVDDIQTGGHHRVIFNAANLPGGVYFYRLKTGSRSQVRKALLVR